MKKLSLVLAIGLGLVLMAGGAFAASITGPLTVNATVSATAKLHLDKTSISFPDVDPDTVGAGGLISANENPVTITAKVKTAGGNPATLTHKAETDLASGTDQILISNVTWTVSGTGFIPGTMSHSAPVTAGSWLTSGNRDGIFNYFLANSWSYAVGNYITSSTYTLSTP